MSSIIGQSNWILIEFLYETCCHRQVLSNGWPCVEPPAPAHRPCVQLHTVATHHRAHHHHGMVATQVPIRRFLQYYLDSAGLSSNQFIIGWGNVSVQAPCFNSKVPVTLFPRRRIAVPQRIPGTPYHKLPVSSIVSNWFRNVVYMNWSASIFGLADPILSRRGARSWYCFPWWRILVNESLRRT